MALIKFGSIVTAASGKIGGHFFSNGQGGHTLNTNGRALGKHQTEKKLWGYIKRSASKNAQMWQGLTDAQRAAWAAESANWPTENRVGDIVSLRGYSLFLKVNGALNSVEVSSRTTPGPKAVLTALSSIVVNTLTTSSVEVSTSHDPDTDERLAIAATRGMSAGRKAGEKDFRILDVINGAVLPPINITNNYIEVFGNPIQGSYVTFKAYMVNANSGQVGLPVYATSVVS